MLAISTIINWQTREKPCNTKTFEKVEIRDEQRAQWVRNGLSKQTEAYVNLAVRPELGIGMLIDGSTP